MMVMRKKEAWDLFNEGSANAVRRLLHFGDFSSLHGLRFVTERHRSWFCRIFWMLALLSCGWALFSLLRSYIQSASEAPLSFTPDTSRLPWQTVFPAVTVCEKYKYKATLHKLESLYPEYMEHLKLNYDYKKMFADMCFGANACDLCTRPCAESINCSVNFRNMADEVRKPCTSLIHDCKWMGEPIDCCEHFLPLDSDFGTCFSFNTLQSKLSGSVPIFKSNISTGPGYLSFFKYEDLNVYVHGGDDIPWLKTEEDMKFGAEDNIDYTFRKVLPLISSDKQYKAKQCTISTGINKECVVEMTNDPLVREMDLNIRKCRFPNELISSDFGKSFQIYGYSTCIITCETELMFQRCHCINHLRDIIYEEKLCNFTGSGCLATYAAERRLLSTEALGDLCRHCLPSCEEIELTRVYVTEYDYEDEDEDEQDQQVTIRMVGLPTVQYRRNVVRTKLDLVVSIGGLVGLFFGASLLSLVECFYFLCLRSEAYR